MKAFLQRYRPRREHVFRLLGSLLLALVVWIYVTISQNPEQQVSFEEVFVEARGLATGLVLTDAQGVPLATLERVSLTVWAPQSEHPGLTDLRVYVDLGAIQDAGTYELPVRMETGRAVRTWKATPERITVRIEPQRQALLPIEVVLLGQPGMPYIVGTPRVDPSQAVVRGPLSRLNLVKRVEARVDLAGRVAAVENTPVAIVAVDEAGNKVEGVTVVPEQVTLSVPISLKGGYVAVSVVPVTGGRPAAGYYLQEVDVSPDTVTIFSNDPAVLASVRYLETMPVDLSGRRQDFTLTVALNLPPNIALINSPSEVTVTVRLGTIAPELRLAIPVRLSGVETGLEAEWEPQWLDVRVRGSLETLRGLALDDLWAVVDLQGLDAGEYDRAVTFLSPPGIEVTPLYTNTVHVRLIRPPTPTPFPTAEISPTLPFSPTVSPAVTPTPTPSAEPTPTATPTPPPSPSVTPAITDTPTRMPSPTPTP